MTSFPRQHARTRGFTLGVPRAFTSGTSPDGPVVLFLRTDRGDDAVTHLWRHDPVEGTTRKLVDARELETGGELPPEERARRERAREQAGGITTYAVDRDLRVAAFALAGRLFTVDLATGERAEQPVAGPAFDPRPSPDGTCVAYHAADGLHLVELGAGAGQPGRGRTLLQEPGVSWGRAEFVAAEEMGRERGFWWSPDGARLVAARVDERAVPVWHLADPAQPWTPAVPHRYPAAGTVNAEVSLAVVDVATGAATPVVVDRRAAEYVASVSWGPGPLTVLVQPRDQRSVQVLTVAAETGATTPVHGWSDEAWVELVPGSPAWAGDLLLTVEDRADRGHGGTRTLCADGAPVTPEGLQIREVVHASAGFVAFLASEGDPTQVHAYRLNLEPPHDLDVWSVTDGQPGVHREVAGDSPDDPWVRISRDLDRPGPRIGVTVARAGQTATIERELEVVAEVPVVTARPRLLELGPRRLRGALLLPTGAGAGDRLPVLLDPYGGPHAQRVVQTGSALLTSQWLADQGFAVLVVDGRGTPGRGPGFERAVHHDLASAVLEDQVTALHAAARLEPRLDLSRVGIRGWSFGGFLAALAVLRRPDVFHAAVAGAPVTDWRLYDTHYTERYLGQPSQQPEAYRLSSLVDEDGTLVDAAPWSSSPPELLLIHGLADDNVVAAHALRLSAALLATGRLHRFLPLSGVTHMTPQEEVAEHLLGQQVRFLQEALGRTDPG